MMYFSSRPQLQEVAQVVSGENLRSVLSRLMEYSPVCGILSQYAVSSALDIIAAPNSPVYDFSSRDLLSLIQTLPTSIKRLFLSHLAANDSVISGLAALPLASVLPGLDLVESKVSDRSVAAWSNFSSLLTIDLSGSSLYGLKTLRAIAKNIPTLQDFKAAPLSPQTRGTECLQIILHHEALPFLRALEITYSKPEKEIADILLNLLTVRGNQDRLEILVLEEEAPTSDSGFPVPIETVMEIHRICPNLRYLPFQLPAAAVIKDDKILLPNIPHLTSIALPAQYSADGEEDMKFIAELYPELQSLKFECMNTLPFRMDAFAHLTECHIRGDSFPAVEAWPPTLTTLRCSLWGGRHPRPISWTSQFLNDVYSTAPDLKHLDLAGPMFHFRMADILAALDWLPKLESLSLMHGTTNFREHEDIIPIIHANLLSFPRLPSSFVPVAVWMPKLQKLDFSTANVLRAPAQIKEHYFPEVTGWVSGESTGSGDFRPTMDKLLKYSITKMDWRARIPKMLQEANFIAQFSCLTSLLLSSRISDLDVEKILRQLPLLSYFKVFVQRELEDCDWLRHPRLVSLDLAYSFDGPEDVVPPALEITRNHLPSLVRLAVNVQHVNDLAVAILDLPRLVVCTLRSTRSLEFYVSNCVILDTLSLSQLRLTAITLDRLPSLHLVSASSVKFCSHKFITVSDVAKGVKLWHSPMWAPDPTWNPATILLAHLEAAEAVESAPIDEW